jgi:hypothetical protein
VLACPAVVQGVDDEAENYHGVSRIDHKRFEGVTINLLGR